MAKKGYVGKGSFDEKYRREFLGDDDIVVLLQSQIDRLGVEHYAKSWKMPVDEVRPGTYRRTPNGMEFIQE